MKKFIQWLICNIGIGIMPILIKCLISYVVPDINFKIIDLSDLIVLTLLLCLSILNEDKSKYFENFKNYLINLSHSIGAIFSSFLLTLNILVQNLNITITENKLKLIIITTLIFYIITTCIVNIVIIYKSKRG